MTDNTGGKAALEKESTNKDTIGKKDATIHKEWFPMKKCPTGFSIWRRCNKPLRLCFSTTRLTLKITTMYNVKAIIFLFPSYLVLWLFIFLVKHLTYTFTTNSPWISLIIWRSHLVCKLSVQFQVEAITILQFHLLFICSF